MDQVIVKKQETNIYLAASYLAYGGKLLRNETDRSDLRHIRFVVEGDPKVLERAEDDWYSESDDRIELPRNFARCYSEHLKTLKALIHA